MLGKINHAVILYVLFAALKEDLWFCNNRITSTCWVPCPLGLLRCRDWIDRLRCLTSKSRLAARATDADLFQGLKCPWHGVILPAQARMLSKMGFLLTSFGCRVVQSIANHIGKKKTAPAQHREYLGSQVKVGDITSTHRWKRPTNPTTVNTHLTLFWGTSAGAVWATSARSPSASSLMGFHR